MPSGKQPATQVQRRIPSDSSRLMSRIKSKTGPAVPQVPSRVCRSRPLSGSGKGLRLWLNAGAVICISSVPVAGSTPKLSWRGSVLKMPVPNVYLPEDPLAVNMPEEGGKFRDRVFLPAKDRTSRGRSHRITGKERDRARCVSGLYS